ncbi:hypothetical protein BD311DRAFT_231958 [Dichomitus squalens]|uniref:DUF6534 domain-containing protein n=1 Tax=Dichomitus squalens TaxID=114155 RepID=A0A4Q9MRL4_9APHY|nr:hypothetical protein BD311DRAFT_231958 [Dichomitus squalens]
MEPVARTDVNNSSSDTVLLIISTGTWLSLLLTGHSAQEAWTYFRRYPKDGYDMKCLIAVLCCLTALHEGFVIRVNYACMYQLRPSADAGSAIWQLWEFWLTGTTACTTLLVSRFFFARRVYKLEHRPLVFVVIVGTMLLGGLALTILSAVHAATQGIRLNRLPAIVLLISLLGISFLLDVFITIRLVVYLRNSRTGFKNTDNIISKLILFSVNTGLLTWILTLIPIIFMAATVGNNWAWYPVVTTLAPIHTSVVLAAVNSRRSLVDRGSEGIELRSFDLDVSPRPQLKSTIHRIEVDKFAPINVPEGSGPQLRLVLEPEHPACQQTHKGE